MKNAPIYLDYAATTPVLPEVIEAMLPYFNEVFGNPASKSHSYGNAAAAAVEKARSILSETINARGQEVIFTSGATEAINLAIKGVALANKEKGKHFITVATEHKAVLDCFQWLKDNGFETTILPVNSDGILETAALEKAIRPDTVMASIMTVNNETGVIQNISKLGEVCHREGVYFMTDATQALGKIPIDVKRMHIDVLAASSHKIYGPKGIGMLYTSRSNPKVKVQAIQHGGGHEKGLRSGTLPTPLIVGFGAAVALACRQMNAEQVRLSKLRDLLQETLLSSVQGASVNGHIEHRVPGILNISLPPVDAEALVASLSSKLAFSTGSACTSEKIEASHVLSAIGADHFTSSRFAIGKFTTKEEIIATAEAINSCIHRLKKFC